MFSCRRLVLLLQNENGSGWVGVLVLPLGVYYEYAISYEYQSCGRVLNT